MVLAAHQVDACAVPVVAADDAMVRQLRHVALQRQQRRQGQGQELASGVAVTSDVSSCMCSCLLDILAEQAAICL